MLLGGIAVHEKQQTVNSAALDPILSQWHGSSLAW